MIYLFLLFIDTGSNSALLTRYIGQMANGTTCVSVANDLNEFAKRRGDPNRYYCSDTKLQK